MRVNHNDHILPWITHAKIYQSIIVIVLFLGCTLTPQSAYSQQLTGINFNYQVRWTSAFQTSSESGSEEPRWIAAACDDTNGVANEVVRADGTVNCGTRRFEERSGDCSNQCFFSLNTPLLHATNVSSVLYDIGLQTWEHDGGVNDRFDNGDDDQYRINLLASAATEAGASEWAVTVLQSQNTTSIFDRGFGVESAWRYNRGERDAPINFGEVNGTEFHFNFNRSPPSGANGNIGYSDDWNLRAGADVTYQFEIRDTPKRVTISTSHSVFNLDTYIGLYDDNGSDANLIEEDDDDAGGFESLIQRDLCPGIYTVVVESFGATQEGQFSLQISTGSVSLSGGSIAGTLTSGGTGGTLAVCDGAPYNLTIGSTSAHGSITGGSPSYQWQRRLITQSQWTDIFGADGETLEFNETIGSEDVQFRRELDICGQIVFSNNVITINSIDNDIDGGEIFLANVSTPTDNTFMRAGSPFELTLLNDEDPDGNPNPLTHRWVKTTGSDVDTVGTGTFQSLQPSEVGGGNPEEEDFTLNRLSTNACFVSDASNFFDFTVIDPRGEISGQVAAPMGGSPIQGVEVCAILDPFFGDSVDRLYAVSMCDTTDGFGDYSIVDLYTGDPGGAGVRYNVVASFLDHDLRKPPENVSAAGGDSIYVVDLRNNGTSSGNDFNDLTAISIQGNVFHDFNMIEYGKADVVVFAEQLIQGFPVPIDSSTTDELGNYSLALPSPGEYTIRPEFSTIVTNNGSQTPEILEHDFSPASITQVFIVNTADLNFEDETLQEFVIGYGGACDRDIGMVPINLIDRDNGNQILMEHEIVNSMQRLFVPARDYDIDILGDAVQLSDVTNGADPNLVTNQLMNLPNDSAIVSFFPDTVFIEVQEAPRVVLNGLDALIDDSCGAGTALHNIPILEQHVTYPNITVEILEGPETCPLDTGMFQIAVGIQNLPALPISDGEAMGFLLQGGLPNFNPDHTLTMTLNAIDAFNQPSNEINQTFVTTGAQSNGTDFISLSPEIPILVLHDPPTDAGFAFWETETEINFTSTTFLNRSIGGGAYAAINVGAAFSNGLSVLGITFSIGTEAIATGETSVSGVTNTNSSTSFSHTTRINNRVSTSADESRIGDDADVVMTMISAQTFSESDILAQEGCELTTTTDFAISSDSIAALSLRTMRDIEEVIIPDLEEIAANEDDEGVRNGLEFSIEQWRGIIASNEEEKRRAFIDNPSDSVMHIAIGSGVNFETSISRDTTYSSSFEYVSEIDMSAAVGGRLLIGGMGGEGNVFVEARREFTIEPSTDQDTTESFTTGFSLFEDDQGDQLLIAVYEDSRYGTPMFNVIGGSSSCPYVEYNEEAPVARTNRYSIVADDPLIVNNVEQDGSINRRFSIFNNSNSDISFNVIRDFAFGPTSQVRINGSLDNLVNLTVGANSNVQIFVNISKVSPGVGPANENIRIRIAPDCGGDFEDNNEEMLTYTVNYISDISPVTIARPFPNQIVNITDNNRLAITMRDYDIARFDNLGLQFTRQGAGSLMDDTNFSFPSSVFNPNSVIGTIREWDLSNIEQDGIYEIRLSTTMDGSQISNGSDIVSVVVDRQRPIVFGVPEPVDDHYDQSANDVLSVSYNELIRASSAGLMVEIENLVTGEIIPAQATIFENRIRIVENTALNSLAPSAYRVTLSGIEDLAGNSADTYRWVFLVGDFFDENLACLYDVVVSNNNFDQNAINATSYRARFISSDGAVNGAGTTTFVAEESVDLEPGFEVTAGGEFEADIETCAEE